MKRTNPTGYKALTSRWNTICSSSLNPLDLGRKLIQDGVVDPLNVEQAMTQRTKSDQLHSLLLNTIQNGTPGIFERFLAIIGSDCSTKWLSDELAEVFKKEAACGSDLLRHQSSCLQGYGGSEPLRQQFSSQACGVQRQLSSPGSFQYGRTPMGSQVDSGWELVDDTELGECNFQDIRAAVGRDLDGVWKDFGAALGIAPSVIKGVAVAHPGDPGQCLFDILDKWVRKDYNHHRFGPPSWRTLVKAVASNVGGQNPALAEKIANSI